MDNDYLKEKVLEAPSAPFDFDQKLDKPWEYISD